MSTTSSEVMHVRFRTVDGIAIRYAESDERQDNPILLTNPWPESLYAFLPIWQAVARTSYQTKERIAPGEALSRADALRCATANGAYLTFDEHKKGSLETGKLADVAVLSADPLTTDESSIADTRSLMTMVGGRIVHETPNWLG